MSAAIQAARRIDAFLKDDVIAKALSDMERRYYEEFIAAESSEQRVRAWAKAKMLRDFETQLKIVSDAGETETLQAARASRPTPKEQ